MPIKINGKLSVIVDPEVVREIIAEIVHEKMLPQFGKLNASQIRQKSSPSDLVTEIDEAVEAALKKALLDVYPGATLIGEELAAADPQTLKSLEKASLKDGGAFWIVDPLDGTRNFVKGKKEFGTIVALVDKGETQMGWIYAAPEEKCAVAVRDEGAQWDREDLLPSTVANDPLKGSRSMGWLSEEWAARIVDPLRANFETQGSHCSAYAYLKIACGDSDFKLSSRIYPWDHAAGVLLVCETGGKAAYLDDGGEYCAGPPVDRPLLVSRKEGDWSHIANTLLGSNA